MAYAREVLLKVVASAYGRFWEEAGIFPVKQCGFWRQRSTTYIMFAVRRICPFRGHGADDQGHMCVPRLHASEYGCMMVLSLLGTRARMRTVSGTAQHIWRSIDRRDLAAFPGRPGHFLRLRISRWWAER